MNILIILVLAGFVIYFLIKAGLYIYRPFFLQKTISNIEAQYDKLLARLNNDIDEAVENHNKWKSGDRVILIVYQSENELKDRINEAMASKIHAQEVNEKFIRLRERLIGNYKKLADAIFGYKRYLTLRLNQLECAAIYSNILTSGVATVDEFAASTNEYRVAIEENERRLNALLDYNPQSSILEYELQ